MQPLGLEAAGTGSDRLLLPEDVAAFRQFRAPARPHDALVSSLDAISATRRDIRTLADEADLARIVVADAKASPLGGLSDLPSHTLRDVVRLTEAFMRDELGDARSCSLDSPKSRQPRLAALRQMR